MALKHFRLPDVGEGLTEAEILGWSVAVGESVTVNQILVEIETAKAAVELPSPFAGVVRQLLVEPGSTVDVGTPIITIETADAEGGAVEPGPGQGEPAAKREPVLVGYGVAESATTRRARRTPGGPGAGVAPAPALAPVAPVAPEPAPAPEPVAATATVTTSATHVLAKPLVRKLAKDLGVDLTTIVPARPDGVITREEVERAAAAPAAPAVSATAPAPAALAEDRRVPIKGVRKATAAAMVASAFTAPHVTEFLTLDVTRTVKLVERLRAQPEFTGLKVSPLLITARALVRAVAKHPEINASWDDAAQEIVLRGSVNLGIAAATPRGLVVPNIKGAERLGLRELAGALAGLTATAREGKTPLADLTGGTVTITNVGVFGVDTGTPILNPGEAAILAFGAIKQQPWVHKGKVKPRWVTTLALSFDHRLVDGELGSRFLREVGRGLEDPAAVLL
ncbi:dihydrolipoamide acetyltransferase family protein [Actinospica robiniae]|uniref:dihydrolipoamide acetyltransferase family protein n=1 Tax=Actinospica robiniae TaxID=304901 RepID=UPI000404EF97|nr:dihydrolipoamide acetyltransferase family protein [Actinospica robiniae]